MYNICFIAVIFPNSLKIAEIIPIYKKGSSCKSINYRPILILLQFDKILKKLISNRLYKFLTKKIS